MDVRAHLPWFIPDATSLVIPDSVTTIDDELFKNCHRLISVTIPNSVTSIGSSAFFGCHGLTSVFTSDSVTSIGEFAFFIAVA